MTDNVDVAAIFRQAGEQRRQLLDTDFTPPEAHAEKIIPGIDIALKQLARLAPRFKSKFQTDGIKKKTVTEFKIVTNIYAHGTHPSAKINADCFSIAVKKRRDNDQLDLSTHIRSKDEEKSVLLKRISNIPPADALAFIVKKLSDEIFSHDLAKAPRGVKRGSAPEQNAR